MDVLRDLRHHRGPRQPIIALWSLAIGVACLAVPTARAEPPEVALPPEGALSPGGAPPPEGARPLAEAGEAGEREAGRRPALAAARDLERETLDGLLGAPSWPKRAIAAVRLERYGCEDSRRMLVQLLGDRSWQVRCYAVRSLGRKREAADEGWFVREQHPRVLRTALRFRYAIDMERLARGVRRLADSGRLGEKLLAAELGAASGDAELREVARESLKKVILRMSRSEAGAFSPRLAFLTGQDDLRRAHRWQRWYLAEGRGSMLRSGYFIDESGPPLEPSLIAQLDAERFALLEEYMERLSTREVDLAVCLDCTASMSGEIAAAQGGIDDLMLFVGDVVAKLRVGLMAYRDRHDKFETKGWDFTTSIDEARRRLWQLEADGGGDSRESVYEAMKLAYTGLAWMVDHTKVLIVVGDAPPHVGRGAGCIDLAGRAARAEVTTHVIQCEGEEIEHFPEIAEAGGGKCVSLADDDLLIPEIAGLTLGGIFEDEFREFFDIYLWVCR